jgi:hypothetical protein
VIRIVICAGNVWLNKEISFLKENGGRHKANFGCFIPFIVDQWFSLRFYSFSSTATFLFM